MRLEIKKFDFKTLKYPIRILIIGGTGTGKSTIIKRILWQMRNKIRIPYLVSRTAQQNGEYPMIPESLTFNHYDPEKIKQFISYSGKVFFEKKKGNSKYVNKVVGNLLALDDILGDTRWKNDKNLETIIYLCRHIDLNLIMSIQYGLAANAGLRDNFSHVFITGATSAAVKKKLFDHYWDVKFGNKDKFMTVFERCTEGYNSIVLDRTRMPTATDITECVFFARPPDHKLYPPYRLGAPGLWKIHEKVYDENWREKMYKRDTLAKEGSDKLNVSLVGK